MLWSIQRRHVFASRDLDMYRYREVCAEEKVCYAQECFRNAGAHFIP